jgi:hypothetical protein
MTQRLIPILLLLVTPTASWTQATSTGTVIGQVKDEKGGFISAAAVTLTDVATGTARSVVTNNAGRYLFIDTPPGVYSLAFSKSGFAQSQVAAQRVEVGSTLTIDVTLQIGALQTIVNVTASAAAGLQTSNATIGTTIDFAALLDLPNLGRDASTLVELQPVVAPTGQVAGAVRDQSSFQLDGVNNSSDMDGTMNLYTPSYASNGGPTGVMPTPVESIEEVKVATVGQTADFNASAGGQIMMVTRRGGHQWHGSLYEFYFGTDVGAANKWVNNHVPDPMHGLPYTALPASHYNRYGIAGGGPLLPRLWGGKTYVFANYEGFRNSSTTTFERASPTPLMRLGVIQLPDTNGRFQAFNLNPYPVTYHGVTYQPAVCSNGQLCDPRGLGINPLITQLWSKYMPLPNDPSFGDQVNTQGYLAPVATPQKSAALVTRLDHDFGPNWRFMAAYRYYGFTQLTTSRWISAAPFPAIPSACRRRWLRGRRSRVPSPSRSPRPSDPGSPTTFARTTCATGGSMQPRARRPNCPDSAARWRSGARR